MYILQVGALLTSLMEWLMIFQIQMGKHCCKGAFIIERRGVFSLITSCIAVDVGVIGYLFILTSINGKAHYTSNGSCYPPLYPC